MAKPTIHSFVHWGRMVYFASQMDSEYYTTGTRSGDVLPPRDDGHLTQQNAIYTTALCTSSLL